MDRRAPLIFVCLIGLWGCGPGDPKDSHFKGTWKHVFENGIAGTKEEEVVEVTADGKKFRWVRRTPAGEEIEVYDGDTLFTKTTWNPVDLAGLPAEGMEPTPPSESARKVPEHETGPRRFWAHTLPGHGEPGGLLANRESVLYQVKEKRPEGEFSAQRWQDAKTGVVLRRVDSVYSSQVRSLVTQDTWECQTIDYGPVDPSAFQKP